MVSSNKQKTRGKGKKSNVGMAKTIANSIPSVRAAAQVVRAGYNAARNLELALPKLGITSVSKGGTFQRDVTAPVSIGHQQGWSTFSITAQSKTSVTVTGTSMLGAARQTTSGANELLFVASLNPAVLVDRLGVMARTYDKYVFRRVTATYTPSVGTGTSGSVFMYIERDADDPPVSAGSAAELMSQENATMGPVWEKATTTLMRDPHERRTYFTNFGAGIELRESEQFKVFVSGQGINTTGTVGFVQVSYELDLIAPVYAQSDFNYNLTTVPLPGFYGYASGNFTFTTNSASSASFPPFGMGNLINNCPLIEIYIAQTATANGFITIGASGPSLQTAFQPGAVLYLSQCGAAMAQTTGAYLFPTLQAAYKGDINAALYNTGVQQNLFTGNVAVWWRPLMPSQQLLIN